MHNGFFIAEGVWMAHRLYHIDINLISVLVNYDTAKIIHFGANCSPVDNFFFSLKYR